MCCENDDLPKKDSTSTAATENAEDGRLRVFALYMPNLGLHEGHQSLQMKVINHDKSSLITTAPC